MTDPEMTEMPSNTENEANQITNSDISVVADPVKAEPEHANNNDEATASSNVAADSAVDVKAELDVQAMNSTNESVCNPLFILNFK